MLERVTIHLDTVRKYRNQSEYRSQQRATCIETGESETGDGFVITILVRRMLDSLAIRPDTIVKVYRDGKPTFTPFFASAYVPDKERQPPQLRKD